jgi:hypothetical protein
MGEKEKTNFSLTGIEDDLIKAAVQETIGRELMERRRFTAAAPAQEAQTAIS